MNEVPAIAGLAAGPAFPSSGVRDRSAVDFFDVKGDLEALIGATGEPAAFRFTADAHPALHPGQTARMWRGDRTIGWLGRLHPEVEARLELTYSAIVFELELEPLLAARVPRHEEVSRFPSVRRDLAVVVDEKSTVQEILARVRASAGASAHGSGAVRRLPWRGNRYRTKESRNRLEFAGCFPHPYRRRHRCRRGTGHRRPGSGNQRHDTRQINMALTKAEIAEALFDQLGLNKREARELVDVFFEELRAALATGEQVKLSGFGNFDLRSKNQRPGRNPKTGEEIPISARRVVTFRPGQKLKARVEAYAGTQQ